MKSIIMSSFALLILVGAASAPAAAEGAKEFFERQERIRH